MFDLDNVIPGDCFGSRSIDFNGNSDQGLLSVNCHDQSSLRLLVISGHSNYQGQLVFADSKVRFENDDSTTLRTIVGYLLGHDDCVTSTYQPIEAHQLLVTLRQRRDNGIVKILWTGRLCKTSDALSSLCLTLNQQHEQLHQARCDQGKLKASVQEWKEIAESMQHRMQIEKDILTHQFYQLFKTTQSKFLKLSMDLDRLQRQENILQDPAIVTIKPQRSKMIQSVGFSEEQPDDHERLWDSSPTSRTAEHSISKIQVFRTETLTGQVNPFMPESEIPHHIAVERSSQKTLRKLTEIPPKNRLDSTIAVAMTQNKTVHPSVMQHSVSYISSTPSKIKLSDAIVLYNPDDLYLDPPLSVSLSQTKSSYLKRRRIEEKEEQKKSLSNPACTKKVSLSEASALLDDSDDDGGW